MTQDTSVWQISQSGDSISLSSIASMRAICFLTFSFSLSDLTELGLGLLTLKLLTMGTSASAFIERLSGVENSRHRRRRELPDEACAEA